MVSSVLLADATGGFAGYGWGVVLVHGSGSRRWRIRRTWLDADGMDSARVGRSAQPLRLLREPRPFQWLNAQTCNDEP